MRDEQHGEPETLPHVGQDLLHHDARLCIQRTERLVHQQYLGAGRQRADNADALLHSPRQLVRIMVFECEQSSQPKQRPGRRSSFMTGAALHFQTELHVLANRHPGKQRILLKHHATLGARPTHLLAINQYAAPRVFDESRHDIQQR